MTKEEAIKLHESQFWETMSDKDIATFQLFEPKLCIPFDVFHSALEKTLNRPVFTHEFAFPKELQRELLGEKNPPTIEEIMGLIPKDKNVILVVKEK